MRKNDLLLLVMAFVLRFRLCSAACQALLTLLDIIIPGCVVTSTYFIDRVFGFDNRNVIVHYFCANSECMEYFGVTVPTSCQQCGAVYNQNAKLCEQSFMFTLSVGEQLKNILDKPVNWDYIFSTSRQQRGDTFSDVVDGVQYSKRRGQADVTLQFNCDGAPIFNSSKFSIWPLICAVNELPSAVRNCNMMLHSLWFGRVKPCVTTFLQPFVTEINDLYNNGFKFVHSLTGEEFLLHVNATLCICDAPARAMLQSLSQFNGHFGCGFCYHPGKRVEKGSGTVQVYPMTSLYARRTSKETLKHAEEAVISRNPVLGVKGPSILGLLPNFDVIRCVIPDYMHCVLLGVVRQFIGLWTDSCNHNKPFYIRNIKNVDEMLKSIKPPDEIHRLPRSISDRKFWKASEYKNFLLLYSPLILKSFLPKHYYKHWLLLCNGVRLLLEKAVTDVMISTSRNCLNKFVTLVPDLYGMAHVSYNVHVLCHLPDSVKDWGPLWSHSAFVYENALGFLKKMYHGTQLVPKQVFKYFTAWNKLQYYSCLLLDSESAVCDLFNNFLTSNTSFYTSFQISDFIGVRKSISRCVAESQRSLVQVFLGFNESVKFTVESFDRFLIKNKLFSTTSYSHRYRRNNSFILLSNGCFADIDCCVSVKTCTCTTCKCNCNRNVVLIVTCYSSLRAQREFDHYVGIDLMQFVRKVRQSDQQLLAISPSDVVDKCVTINISNNRYAMQLPKFEIM